MQSQTGAVAPTPSEHTPSQSPGGTREFDWLTSLPFIGVQVAAIVGVILTGWSWTGLALAVGLYYLRMFGLTAGYHRYFSHRSYKTGRVFQFVLAWLGAMATQKGPLWWAAHHRNHHKYSDEPEDPHSVRQRGFIWAHVGWVLSRRFGPTHYDRIKEFAKYPELMWLNRFHLVPPVVLAAVLTLAWGWWGFLWGFLVSNTLLWHGTFTVNSLAHLWGRRAYATPDDSRNSLLIALITLGEGWHNNHHYYQASERQGFYWYQLDVTHCVLKSLSWLGVVWNLVEAPAHVRDRRIGRELPATAPTAEASETPAAALSSPDPA